MLYISYASMYSGIKDLNALKPITLSPVNSRHSYLFHAEGAISAAHCCEVYDVNMRLIQKSTIKLR